MSKRLIIAEKPSLGRAIANALNVKKFTGEKSNGYYENDKYIITWCFGHLFKLKDIGDYEGLNNISWEDIALPFLPNPFELKYNPGRNEEEGEGIKKQVEIIKELISKDEIDEIVYCGDADREGQVIVNEVLEYIGNKKRVTRLWLPEQTEDTIQKQIMNCKENNIYNNLSNEGLTRIYMDWFLGINLSVFLSVKAKTKLNVGRVVIPIVKYIYDREQAIKNFKVEKYFQLESKTEKEIQDMYSETNSEGIRLELADVSGSDPIYSLAFKKQDTNTGNYLNYADLNSEASDNSDDLENIDIKVFSIAIARHFIKE